VLSNPTVKADFICPQPYVGSVVETPIPDNAAIPSRSSLTPCGPDLLVPYFKMSITYVWRRGSSAESAGRLRSNCGGRQKRRRTGVLLRIREDGHGHERLAVPFFGDDGNRVACWSLLTARRSRLPGRRRLSQEFSQDWRDKVRRVRAERGTVSIRFQLRPENSLRYVWIWLCWHDP